MKELRSITNAEEYFKELGECKEQYLICLAVKSAFYNISTETVNTLMNLGVEDLSSKGAYPNGWQGYLFVMEQGKILLNKLADVHMSLIEQMNVADISMQLVSKPYYSGDTAKIILDGYDLSVNSRGLNVVVFDVQNRRLIDSVCFDFYPDDYRKPCSRLKDFLDIPLPKKIGCEINSSDVFDIDIELDNIIKKYNLDEYYPRYFQAKKANEEIKLLANEWGENESIACIAIGKKRDKSLLDERYFYNNLNDYQRNQVDFIHLELKDIKIVELFNLPPNFKVVDEKILQGRRW